MLLEACLPQDRTIADVNLDRLIRSSYRPTLKGESMRQLKSATLA